MLRSLVGSEMCIRDRYYTDNLNNYRLWRRTTNAFNPATDNTISPDGDFEGRGPYWEEISVGGAGRDFQISPTAPLTRSNGSPLQAGDEWLQSTSGNEYTRVISTDGTRANWGQTSGAADQSASVSPGSGITCLLYTSPSPRDS